MAIPRFLAMTAAEMQKSPTLPRNAAWLACHFSPYGAGLSNLPASLPKGSLLVVDDEMPISNHDPGIVGAQLRQVVETLECAGVLLDFQRPQIPETATMADALCQALPCPVAVSPTCGRDLCCPIFLPPLPCGLPLREHLARWKGRVIWLELAREGQIITLTAEGVTQTPFSSCHPEDGFSDEALHCHYSIALQEEEAVFTLWRTREDLTALEAEAETLGVEQTVGLWQELAVDSG